MLLEIPYRRNKLRNCSKNYNYQIRLPGILSLLLKIRVLVAIGKVDNKEELKLCQQSKLRILSKIKEMIMKKMISKMYNIEKNNSK